MTKCGSCIPVEGCTNNAQRGENAQAVKVIHVRSFVQNISLPAVRKARLTSYMEKRFPS